MSDTTLASPLPGMPADKPPAPEPPTASEASPSPPPKTRKRSGARRGAAASAAPASDGSGSGARRRGPRTADEKLRERLVELYAGLSVMLVMVNPSDAAIIMDESEACADAALAMAKRYPGFRKWIERADEGSALVMFAIAHGKLVARLLSNHEVLPKEIGAALSPEPGDLAAMFGGAIDLEALNGMLEGIDPATLAAFGGVAATPAGDAKP